MTKIVVATLPPVRCVSLDSAFLTGGADRLALPSRIRSLILHCYGHHHIEPSIDMSSANGYDQDLLAAAPKPTKAERQVRATSVVNIATFLMPFVRPYRKAIMSTFSGSARQQPRSHTQRISNMAPKRNIMIQYPSQLLYHFIAEEKAKSSSLSLSPLS